MIGVLRGLQVDIFSKLSLYEEFRIASEKIENGEDLGENYLAEQFKDLLCDSKADEEPVFMTEEEFVCVTRDNLISRIEEVEPIGKTLDYSQLMRKYKLFETGEVDKPSYER